MYCNLNNTVLLQNNQNEVLVVFDVQMFILTPASHKRCFLVFYTEVQIVVHHLVPYEQCVYAYRDYQCQ